MQKTERIKYLITTEQQKMKKVLMIISAISAIACLVLSILSNQIILGVLSSLASFVPICIWFLDLRDLKDQSKKMEQLKSKTDTLEECLTWKEFD